MDGDDIHGDGVNVAAWLEGLAKLKGICISGAVHDQVRARRSSSDRQSHLGGTLRPRDQHDAYSIAAWLSGADRGGSLAGFLKPDLIRPERTVAQVEDWISGVFGLIRGEARRPCWHRVQSLQ